MSKLDDYVGKEYLHTNYGRCIVNSRVKGSRTKVNVTIIDRGKGWDDIQQRYKGVRTKSTDHQGNPTSSWVRGENRMYGENFDTRVEQLKSI